MTILKIMGVKLMIGMIVGFVVDAAVRLARRDRREAAYPRAMRARPLPLQRRMRRLRAEPRACATITSTTRSTNTSHEHGSILRSALKHTAQVTVFIFLITLVLDGALEVVGEDAIGAFLGSNPVLSVFGSALVGLIPNCAASVVIAQLYVDGALGAGAMMAGLPVLGGRGPACAVPHEPPGAPKPHRASRPVGYGRVLGPCHHRLRHHVLAARLSSDVLAWSHEETALEARALRVVFRGGIPMAALHAGITRDEAFALLTDHNKDEFHIEHGETVGGR